MTDTARPTLAERFASHEVWLYVAPDTVDEVHRRITNLLTGREFTIVRQYVGDNPHSFPEVEVNVRLDDSHYRGASEVWRNESGCGTSFRYSPPSTGRFGVSGSYATERETAAAAHNKSHQGVGGNEVAYVYIRGGHTAEEERRDAVIEIVRTNEHGVSTQIVVKPVIRWPNEVAEVEASVLDRVATHLDTSAGPVLNSSGARALAEFVRYNRRSGLQA